VKEPMNEKDSVLESIAAPTVAGQFHYAVIVSEFNFFQLLRGALRTLESHQVGLSNIKVLHVPGAYEIRLWQSYCLSLPITTRSSALAAWFEAIRSTTS
jgi:hypothetical protein